MTHPILSAQFFDKYSPDLGFFTKWQSLYSWHDQLMPIYEWQGVLFVGCTHLPQNWNVKSPRVVFVLCDSESLKSVWYNFEGTVVIHRQSPVGNLLNSHGNEPTPLSHPKSPHQPSTQQKIKPQIPATQASLIPSGVPQKSYSPSAAETFELNLPGLDNPEPALGIPELNLEENKNLSSDAEATLSLTGNEPSASEDILDLALGDSDHPTAGLQAPEEDSLELALSEKPQKPPKIDEAEDLGANAPANLGAELSLDLGEPSLEIATSASLEDDDSPLEEPSIARRPQSPSNHGLALNDLAAADLPIDLETPLDAKPTKAPPTTARQLPETTSPAASGNGLAMDPMEALMASTGISLDDEPAPNLGSEENAAESVAEESAEAEADLLDLGNPIAPPNLTAVTDAANLDTFEFAKDPATGTLIEKEAIPSPLATSPLTVAIETPGATPNPAPPPAAASAKPASKSAIKNPHLEPWVEKAFSEIKLEYRKVMILLKQGDTLKPWRWDEEFVASQPVNSGFSLIAPSPFRIVQRTHKSYHGYVVENDANKKFFDQWNGGETPEHMTVVPIMNQNNMLGVILALGNKTADTKGCLQLMEDKAQELASHVQLASAA